MYYRKHIKFPIESNIPRFYAHLNYSLFLCQQAREELDISTPFQRRQTNATNTIAQIQQKINLAFQIKNPKEDLTWVSAQTRTNYAPTGFGGKTINPTILTILKEA